jgi:ATP-binding cassette subfamily A (ABC1) protein 5
VAVVTVAIVALSAGMNLLSSCNVFLLFLMLCLFGLSMISLAFMVTPVFSKAVRGSSLITLITWALSLICLAVMRTRNGENEEGPVSDVPAACQYLLSLISPVAIVLGLDQVGSSNVVTLCSLP